MHVVAHGGAGSTPDDPDARQAVLDEAVASGVAAETPLDAVCTTVRVLESDPLFNAGVGGARQADGVVRTDAGVMTDERRVGAVCSMPGVEHAVSVARAVLEETPHVLLAGDNAVEFAEVVGIETNADLLTERTRDRWTDEPGAESYAEQVERVGERFGLSDADREGSAARSDSSTDASDPADHDTVGAVAVHDGEVAAATSTGGRWYALSGRVGDVPQVGSGFFATSAGGASATGAGEDIVRTTLSRSVVDHIESNAHPDDAAERALSAFEAETGSVAGVVALDAEGRLGSAYNSAAMQVSDAGCE